MKIKIEANPIDSQKPYENLIPIVKFLLENNNSLSPEIPGHSVNASGFYLDKDGWKCDLEHPIDFDSIRNYFFIPDEIVLSKENNSIFCTTTWVEIRGNIKK